MLRRSTLILAGSLLLAGPAAAQQPLKIALIYGKTGPLEAYARQTEAGFMLGLSGAWWRTRLVGRDWAVSGTERARGAACRGKR